jgi:hypothetical protein
MYPRQAGKNEVGAALVAELLLGHARSGGTIVVCAPTRDPQARISLERSWRALERASGPVLPRRAEHVLHAGDASAVFLSASPAAHVAGHTASIALIADEAQEIDEDWFNRQFRPMAASTAAPAILFGTPWNGQTLLEHHVAANRSRDEVRAGGGAPWHRLHYQVSWREVTRSLPAYGRYVEQERARLGPSHPLYLSQYELIAGQASGRLLSPALLARIAGGHPRLFAPRPGERYVAGFDLGGEGATADRSVLTIARLDRDTCEVVDHRAWQGAPFASVEVEVIAAATQWRLERLVVDGTGLGQVFAASLRRALGEVVRPLVFTAESKSQLGFGLIAAAGSARLQLYEDDGSPESRACRLELRDCRASRGAGQRLSWGSAGGHDDYAVSLALCLRAAAEAGPPRMAVGRRR